jgi:hypothetical protein
MRKNLFYLITPILLVLLQFSLRAQSPPNLGTGNSFALFTASLNINNTGGSTVTGDLGTNSGTITGFPPGNHIGTKHVANATSASAVTDINSAYSNLSGQSCGVTLGTTLGGGQVLTPNVYCINAAATLTGSLVLDGQNNPNSIFIIKITTGGLTTATSSSVTLINMASGCNVYWQINGGLTLGMNSVFRGTALVNGKIDLLQGATLLGRGLSLGGLITLKNNIVTVAFPPVSSTITASGTTTFCAGGSVILSGNTGGVWSTGSTTSAITVTATGNYYVTNTTSCGSVTSNTISVTVNPLPVLSISNGTICNGSSITLSVSGASTYSWAGSGLSTSSGATVNASPTVTTVYTVTGTSAAGCTNTKTVSVTVLSTPTVTVNSATLCAGGSTVLTAGGASTYSWSPPSGLSGVSGFSVTANPTATTIYTVIGTSGTCTSSATSTVIINPTPTLSVNDGTMCPSGSVVLNASGAASYSWSPSTGLSATTGASVTANPTVSSTYSVTGTSTAGCVSTVTVSVTVLPSLTLTVNSATICLGDSVVLSGTGANTYSWSPATSLSASAGTTVSANPTITTIYTITGTVGSCSATTTATVTVNPLPTATISAGGPLVFCQGDSVTLTAGSALSYSWSTGATSQSISVSGAGNYSVSVTDANGCSATSAAVTVTVNVLPTINVNNGVICSGSSATLIAGGANTYSWSPGTGLSATTGATVIANPTVTTIYTITGTSTTNCVNTETTSVTVAPSLTLTVNSPTICTGDSVTLIANGANTYSWSPGTGLSATTGVTVSANPTVTTIYTLTGNAGVCTSTQTSTVTVNALPTATISAGGPLTFCQGDSVALTASAGTTYSWSTGASTQSINVLSAGNYSVTVTNANGCSATSSITTVVVNPLPTITVNNATICPGSSVTLNATGAATYSWMPGSSLSASTGASVNANPTVSTTYTIAGTNSLACTNTTTASVTVLPAVNLAVNSATVCSGESATLTVSGASSYSWTPGTNLSSTTGATVIANPTVTTTYTVTGTSGSCSATQSSTVTVNALPIASITASGPLVFCQGGSVTLMAGAGTTYSWSTGATTPSISVSSSGNYSVTVFNGSGCSAGSSIVTVTVNALPTVSVSASGPTAICQGDFVILTSSPAASYFWSNSATTQSILISSSGNYSVTVTDANGCSATSSVIPVTVDLVPTATISASGPTTFCQGGSVILTSSPGNTYLWSNGAMTQSIAVTTPGDYSVTVTSSGSCSAASAAITVSVNPAPYVNLGNDTTTCGCILLTAYNPGATYDWSSGQDYSTINVCTTGIYWVSVSNGICITTDTIRVTVNPSPNVNISVVTGSVTILDAGNPGGTYLWNTGAMSQTIIATTPGVYYVSVTNQYGCTGSDTTSVGIIGINELYSSVIPINIYPNPSMDKNFTLKFELTDTGAIEIKMLSMLGESVYDERLENFSGVYTRKLNFQHLAGGIYFIEVRSGGRKSVVRIALE